MGRWWTQEWRANRHDQPEDQGPSDNAQERCSAFFFRLNGLEPKHERLRREDIIGQIEGVQPAHPAHQKQDDNKERSGSLKRRHF